MARSLPGVSPSPQGGEAGLPDLEVVLFTVGKRHHVAAREDVKAIRASLRVRAGSEGHARIPVVSLSAVLGLERDTSVDRRVLEVEYWGERVGLEVTAIAGIRLVPGDKLHALPQTVSRTALSQHVLGIMETELGLAVALDLPGLLAEQGVAIQAGP